MITSPQVFEDTHLPEKLLHRNAEVEVLAQAFAPALDGERPADVLIHGPHGVGKTVLTRHTFNRLQARADADWVHVRAMGKTTAGIVRATLRGLGVSAGRTTPREDLCLQLRERVDKPTIVVLDEGDDLSGEALARLLDVPLIAIVPIVHNPDDWFTRIDDSIRQRLHGHELPLGTYGVGELAEILEPRAREGLRSTVDRSYLERIADSAAGRARTAIQTLRAAGEIARERETAVETVAIDEAHERALHRIRQTNLDSLTIHHHVLYELIREAGEVSPEVLNQRYDQVAETIYADREQVPIVKRTRRYKLDKLETYELIDAAESRAEHHTVMDPTVTSDVVDLSTLTLVE